jgi:1,4-alpha-glucan branching enzyme
MANDPLAATFKPSGAASRLSAPVSLKHVTPDMPMGANVVADGATFRVWAPNAIEIHIRLSDRPDSINAADDEFEPSNATRLYRTEDGCWSGFVPGVRDGDYYRFFVVGRGDQPYKRDPYARELEFYDYPDVDCIVRDPNVYPWHDQGWIPPRFNDLVIYQFHTGTFYSVDAHGNDNREVRVAKFLDVIDKLPYLAALGCNAIEPLPIVEFDGPYSLGYNGTDLFSPEMDYAVQPRNLPPYLDKVNRMLARLGKPPLLRHQLEGQVNQFKALIDLCHLHGIAVILDVVYNHAGGFGEDDQSLYFFDRPRSGDNNESLYFTDQGHAGGLIFAYWNAYVRQFLIDNAKFFVEEYHADGFRYDQVTVADDHGGWGFFQDLTSTIRYVKPEVIHIAEYWRDDPSWVIRPREAHGAGCDAVWHRGMRDAIRGVIEQAARGRDAYVDLDPLRTELDRPRGFSASWRAVQYIENHDRQRAANRNDREPRIAALADAANPRSWYARSRARVANGLLLTAPGIPMLFMGQEFLEDKYWSDNPKHFPGTLIWWDGLQQDKAMGDHLQFTKDLIRLRCRHPALRGEAIHVFHVHNANRVIAFHRWLPGLGRDVVVVASLNESAFGRYGLGFPLAGRWFEMFNSDVYDNFVNPNPAGNAGEIHAAGPPMHDLPTSATITIPANSVLVFSRDQGDYR